MATATHDADPGTAAAAAAAASTAAAADGVRLRSDGAQHVKRVPVGLRGKEHDVPPRAAVGLRPVRVASNGGTARSHELLKHGLVASLYAVHRPPRRRPRVVSVAGGVGQRARLRCHVDLALRKALARRSTQRTRMEPAPLHAVVAGAADSVTARERHARVFGARAAAAAAAKRGHAHGTVVAVVSGLAAAAAAALSPATALAPALLSLVAFPRRRRRIGPVVVVRRPERRAAQVPPTWDQRQREQFLEIAARARNRSA